MSRRSIAAVALGLGALLALRPSCRAEGDPPRARVEYRDDRLSAHLGEVPLADVLAEVGQATGAEIRGRPEQVRMVTADFDAVPLTEALPRLLGQESFTLRYGRSGRLRAIELRGGPGAPAVARAPQPPTAALPSPAAGVAPTGPAPTTPPSLALPPRVARHRPLPVPERLAEVLGSDSASFDQIFDLATNQGDGVVRAMAMQVTLSALEREHGLRRSLFTSLRKGQDGSLGAFLQTPGAVELLQFLAAHSREPSVQKKATTLLDTVRPPGSAGG